MMTKKPDNTELRTALWESIARFDRRQALYCLG